MWPKAGYQFFYHWYDEHDGTSIPRFTDVLMINMNLGSTCGLQRNKLRNGVLILKTFMTTFVLLVNKSFLP
jgi:hypothetical protein